MIKIEAGKKEVRNFGLLFGAICGVVAMYLLYRESPAWGWLLVVAGLFAGTGLFAQSVLRPLYIGWMRFAFALGWLNTRVLLGLFFYLIITPTGLVLRLVGKDLLDQKIHRSAKTYWKKRTQATFDPKQMERQF